MNTEKVYFGKLYSVSAVEYNSVLGPNIFLNYEKDALIVAKKNIFGKKYMKDLNTGENYRVKLSGKIGTLYVSRSSLVAFNDRTQNTQAHLPKKMVKTLGNRVLLKNKEK